MINKIVSVAKNTIGKFRKIPSPVSPGGGGSGGAVSFTTIFGHNAPLISSDIADFNNAVLTVLTTPNQAMAVSILTNLITQLPTTGATGTVVNNNGYPEIVK